MENSKEILLEKWEEIRMLVESMDLDLRKSAIKGNSQAGLRIRRGLRLLKKYTHSLLMASVEADKTKNLDKPPKMKETENKDV
jgi:hypothetical protein